MSNLLFNLPISINGNINILAQYFQIKVYILNSNQKLGDRHQRILMYNEKFDRESVENATSMDH